MFAERTQADENVQHYGRKKITTYYRYALAFDASRIWAMPLQFDKDLILPGEPVLINAGTLGVADVKITDDKEGKPRRVDLALYDKGGTSIFNCVVEVQNTREDSYHHVNILQEDACARFGRLMDSIAAQVNRDNPAGHVPRGSGDQRHFCSAGRRYFDLYMADKWRPWRIRRTW